MTGFSAAHRRAVVVVVAFVVVTLGWALGGWVGVAVAAVAALVFVIVPWRGQPAWSWAALFLGRNSEISLSEPLTVANNRASGGVRNEDWVAVAAVQLLGKANSPTTVTGSVNVATENVVDVAALAPMLHRSLGLTLESLSVVSIGARRGTVGDFPRVYDAEVGTPPYAGRRETWLIARLSVLQNAEALRWRTTVGASAIAAAQQIAAELRCSGLRARVATANDVIELDRRLGAASLSGPTQGWKALRVEGGWTTTYAYPPDALTAATLAQAWTLPVDEVVQNLTIFSDGTATATVTLRTPRPAPTAPSVVLRRLDGQQRAATVANMCAPRPQLHGLRPAPLPETLPIVIGASGVLIGRQANGDRLMIPMTDRADATRVFVAADDAIAKRIIIRTAATGERVCVHTADLTRWASVRMPEVAVQTESRPPARCTVSVVDSATLMPSPRPATVITIAPAGTAPPRGGYEVSIEQISARSLRVTAGGRTEVVEMDLFRAENRYVSLEPAPRTARMPEQPRRRKGIVSRHG